MLLALRTLRVLYEKNCATMGESARSDEGKKTAAIDAVTQLQFTAYPDVGDIVARAIVNIVSNQNDLLIVLAETERVWEAILSKRTIF